MTSLPSQVRVVVARVSQRGQAVVAPLRDRLGRSWLVQNPLRVKLVAVCLALVSLALLVGGTASVFALRGYLIDRADHQLVNVTKAVNPWRPGQLETSSDLFVARAEPEGPRIIHQSEWNTIPDLPENLGDWRDRSGTPFTLDAPDGTPWRVLVSPQGSSGAAIVGVDMSTMTSAIQRLALINVFVGLAVVALMALVGVWLVRRSLRPLGEIEHTAAAIAGGDLTRRVPELDPRTELGQLSEALNTMLNQIESAFAARAASEARARGSEERMRQFVADASHELRTPLTTIRGFAELYRQGAEPDASRVLGRIESEASRMGLLVEDLLLLARLDQARPLVFAPVDLGPVVADAGTAAHAVDPDRPVTVSLPSAPIYVEADEARLRQVVANLVTNALTHTPRSTPVAISLSTVDGFAMVEVADSGPGLAPEQAEHVFERFYRVDKARTRAQAKEGHSGAGLGLAIVAALVAAHNGSVSVQTAPGMGAVFRVRLPLLATDPDAEVGLTEDSLLRRS